MTSIRCEVVDCPMCEAGVNTLKTFEVYDFRKKQNVFLRVAPGSPLDKILIDLVTTSKTMVDAGDFVIEKLKNGSYVLKEKE